MSNKKQTAVDWFMSQLAISSQMSLVHDGVYKQAKELEKQQKDKEIERLKMKCNFLLDEINNPSE